MPKEEIHIGRKKDEDVEVIGKRKQRKMKSCQEGTNTSGSTQE